MVRLNKILIKYEKAIPLILFLLFIIITVPGISWGLLSKFHPHEIIKEVLKAVYGDWEFDTTTFHYTSLPKYVMLYIGKLVSWLGFSKEMVFLSARLFSVFLGGLVVSITFYLTRAAGGNIYTGLLASFLVITNSQMAQDSRFAHNDIYLTFFVSLTAYSMVKYFSGGKRTWLYLAFFECGLAISSKQNGVMLIFALIGLYLFIKQKFIRKNLLRASELLFISIVLTILGFVIGTRKALTSASFYFSNMGEMFINQRTYDIYPGDTIGVFSQWESLATALGSPVFILSIIAFLAASIKVSLYYFKKRGGDEKGMNTLLIFLVFITAIDLPIFFNYSSRPRWFLSLIPLVFILISFFIQDLITFVNNRKIKYARHVIITGAILTLSYSFLRVISVRLMFENDSRLAAGKFIMTLPPKSSIEYTYYPPSINKQVFINSSPYPIHFIKWDWEEDVLPPEYNKGEVGLEERKPEYLILDSFTYSRYSDERVCEKHLAECELNEKLFAGETNYELIASFEYDIPWYIPEVKSVFLNPDIHIFQRVEGE